MRLQFKRIHYRLWTGILVSSYIQNLSASSISFRVFQNEQHGIIKSDTLERLTSIEPKQKIQNEFFGSQDNIKCTLQHEYTTEFTAPTTIVYQITQTGTLADEYTEVEVTFLGSVTVL
jgi:hypothetical protein